MHKRVLRIFLGTTVMLLLLAGCVPIQLLQRVADTLPSDTATHTPAAPAFDLDAALEARLQLCDEALWRSFTNAATANELKMEATLEEWSTAVGTAQAELAHKMNSLRSDLDALPVDECMEPVRESLSGAYDMVEMLAGSGMVKTDTSDPADFLKSLLFTPVVQLELLHADLAAGMFQIDEGEVWSALWTGKGVPEHLRYITAKLALDERSECLLALPFEARYVEAAQRVQERLSVQSSLLPKREDCSAYPVIAERKPVHVRYTLDGPPDTVIVALLVGIENGLVQRFEFPTLPFTYEVTLRTGDRADLNFIPADGSPEAESNLHCEVTADGAPVTGDSGFRCGGVIGP